VAKLRLEGVISAADEEAPNILDQEIDEEVLF